MEDIKIKWDEFVSRKITEVFGENAEIKKPSIGTFIRSRKLIVRNTSTMILKKQLRELPYKRTYSNKGMSAIEEAIYLIEETEKILFPEGDKYFSTLMCDEYDIKHGIEGIHEIIGYFVTWTNTNA